MTIKNYTIGFLLSLFLTLCSFGMVSAHIASHHAAITHEELAASIVALAIVQLCVQLVFFLHLGRGSRTRDLVMLFFAVVTITLLVGGTLWIMANLMQAHALPFDGAITPQYEND
jgi:cytochrome o ubiquinol oxidase operon protein cyoD